MVFRGFVIFFVWGKKRKDVIPAIAKQRRSPPGIHKYKIILEFVKSLENGIIVYLTMFLINVNTAY